MRTPWIIQLPAKTKVDISNSIEQILDIADLPKQPAAKIFIKPNFNNDLNALTGNSTDLRFLWQLCIALKKNGYRNLTVGDGPNTGIYVANIDVLERLGVRRMCKLLDIQCVDLNQSQGKYFKASGKCRAYVAREILESDYLINVAKIKTHTDAVFSCCVKNWMGINVGESKWALHTDLFNNLINNVNIRNPDLNIVEALIGMEGNGPGNGNPVWLGTVIAGNDSFYLDCAIAEKVGIKPEKIPYLCEYAKEHKSNYTESAKKLDLPRLQPASERSLLTKIATSDFLKWLRAIARPLTKLPGTMQLLYHCGIVQDVYDPSEATDHIYIPNDISDDFMTHWCPGRWKEIRATAKSKNDMIDVFSSEHCLRCFYCFWADTNRCVKGKINSRYLKRHIKRFHKRINNTLQSGNLISG